MQIKEDFRYKYQKKKKKKKKKEEEEEHKRSNLKITILSLKPHLVSPFSSGRGGHRVIPLTRSRSPF